MQVEALITRWMGVLVGVAGRLSPGAVAAAGLILAVLLPRTWVETGQSLCPFRLSTGLPCPGCGLTRSVVALAHGDLASSLYFHPLGALVVLMLGLLVVVELVGWARRARTGQADVSLSTTALLDRVARGPLPWLGVAALAVVWIVRLPLFLSGTWTF